MAKSPFPGMDPYLEARWSDVHVTLIGFIKEALQPKLPPALRARSEERVIMESIEDEEPLQAWVSDTAIVETTPGDHRLAPAGGTALTIEPLVVEPLPGPQVDRFVQIIDRTSGNRVVTVIEILSPSNKASGRANRDYLKKLHDYARAGVSIVEIDLLREPTRECLPVNETHIRPSRRTPYYIGIRRAWQSHRWVIYPVSLRQPIPPVPIPLRKTDQEITLELQPLIERVYTAGGHDDIDYTKPPFPPLEGEDKTWTDQLLKERKPVS